MLTQDRPTKSTALDPSLKRKPSMQMLWSLIPNRDGRARLHCGWAHEQLR
jgi:hypothetical protein